MTYHASERALRLNLRWVFGGFVQLLIAALVTTGCSERSTPPLDDKGELVPLNINDGDYENLNQQCDEQANCETESFRSG